MINYKALIKNRMAWNGKNGEVDWNFFVNDLFGKDWRREHQMPSAFRLSKALSDFDKLNETDYLLHFTEAHRLFMVSTNV